MLLPRALIVEAALGWTSQVLINDFIKSHLFSLILQFSSVHPPRFNNVHSTDQMTGETCMLKNGDSLMLKVDAGFVYCSWGGGGSKTKEISMKNIGVKVVKVKKEDNLWSKTPNFTPPPPSHETSKLCSGVGWIDKQIWYLSCEKIVQDKCSYLDSWGVRRPNWRGRKFNIRKNTACRGGGE